MRRPHPIPWDLLEPDDTLRRQARWWKKRALAEREGELALALLGDDLAGLGASPELHAEVATVVGEEREHSEICGRVAGVLGAPVGDGEWATRFDLGPKLASRERAAVLAVTTLCLSETVAMVMIATWRDEAEHPTLRAIETRICADESGHARLGFHWLRETWVGLPMSTKLAVEGYLPQAFTRLERERTGRWRDLYRKIVEERVIPQLERGGVRAARAWKARAAS